MRVNLCLQRLDLRFPLLLLRQLYLINQDRQLRQHPVKAVADLGNLIIELALETNVQCIIPLHLVHQSLQLV
ncbi:hypothetical protein D3C73_1468690 [compost metagenome]